MTLTETQSMAATDSKVRMVGGKIRISGRLRTRCTEPK